MPREPEGSGRAAPQHPAKNVWVLRASVLREGHVTPHQLLFRLSVQTPLCLPLQPQPPSSTSAPIGTVLFVACVLALPIPMLFLGQLFVGVLMSPSLGLNVV
jgi:hypothetical protein